MNFFNNNYFELSTLSFLSFKTDGALGLFKGIVPRTLRKTLVAAFSWTVYEQVLIFVRQKV